MKNVIFSIYNSKFMKYYKNMRKRKKKCFYFFTLKDNLLGLKIKHNLQSYQLFILTLTFSNLFFIYVYIIYNM